MTLLYPARELMEMHDVRARTQALFAEQVPNLSLATALAMAMISIC